MVGGFAGLVIRVARFANGILYNAEVNRLDARDRRPANEHALAAAIRGEIVAMANWISTQAASLQENTRPQDNADLNDDMPNERLGSSSLPARPIYESDANRSYICGGVLSEAVPILTLLSGIGPAGNDRLNMNQIASNYVSSDCKTQK